MTYLEGWGFFYKIETIQIEVTMFFSFQGFQSLAVGWVWVCKITFSVSFVELVSFMMRISLSLFIPLQTLPFFLKSECRKFISDCVVVQSLQIGSTTSYVTSSNEHTTSFNQGHKLTPYIELFPVCILK